MASTSDSRTEERVAAINYVITFYRDLQQLLHYYALLVGTLAELNTEITNNKLAAEQKDAIRNTLVNIRYHSTKCKLFVASMGKKAALEKEQKETIEKAYAAINSGFIPNLEQLEIYVAELNTFFVENVAKHILENNADLLSQVYGGTE